MFFSGYKFASPGAIAVIVCFFLPWVFVSCYGQPIAEFSGFELAAGPEIPGAFGTEQGEPAPILLTLPALGLLVLALAFWAARRRVTNWLDKIGVLLIGLGPLLLLILGLFGSTERQELAQEGIFIEYRIGVWGTLLGLLLIGVGGVGNWLNRGQE